MLKKIRFISFFLICLLFTTNVDSQSLIGSQSNYAGSHALSMNPASMTTSNLRFDIGLFQLGVMVYNDYAFVRSSDAMKVVLTQGRYAPVYIVDGKEKDYLVYDNPYHRPRNLYESLDISILNMMYDIDGKQAIGFSFNTRSYTNATKIPWELPEICTNGTEDSTMYGNYKSHGAEAATIEWAEIALSYSNTVYERYNHKFDIGATVKYLIGYSAAVANIHSLDYDLLGPDSVNINHIDSEAAYSLPLNYDEPFESDNLFNRSIQRGGGLAADLGFFYTRKADTKILRKKRGYYNYNKVNYLWKAGLSIMDIGCINFNKNAQRHHFFADNDLLFEADDLDDVKTMNELSGYLSANYFNGDSTASYVGNSFVIGLPTTLRLQFDYNLYKGFFVNATFIQPIKLFKYSVKAAPRILVEPRFESEYFDFALPVSLYDYKFVHIGASFRFAYLTIGTENIANYLGLGEMNGIDIYVALKFNLTKSSKIDRRDACWR